MSDASNPFELTKHEDLLDAGCEQLAIYLRWDAPGYSRLIYRLVKSLCTCASISRHSFSVNTRERV